MNIWHFSPTNHVNFQVNPLVNSRSPSGGVNLDLERSALSFLECGESTSSGPKCFRRTRNLARLVPLKDSNIP